MEKEVCPHCGNHEFYIEDESAEDLSFRRECYCPKCEKYFTLNYDLVLSGVWSEEC